MNHAFSTCDLCDAHEALISSGQLRVLPPIFHSYGAVARFSGEVMTIKTYEDNSLVKTTLESAGEGLVLVVDGGGSLERALLGGNIATAAARNGWAGIVLWSAVRDKAELAAAQTGVLALGLCPVRSFKRAQGIVGVPLQIAGVAVSQGEWLYADEDGILVSSTKLL